MNAGIIGADPQALRDMATKFETSADQLDGVKGSVQPWVDRGDIWRGLDNQRFVTNWNSVGSSAVTNVAGQLRRAAKDLRLNAEEQDKASAAVGSFSTGSGLFGGGGVGAAAAGVGAFTSEEGSGFWGEANSLLDREGTPGWTVRDLTGILGALGLKSGPGAALSIALATPDLLSELTDPDTSLGHKIGTAGKAASDFASEGLMALGVKAKNPAVLLAGAAVMTWGTALDEARHMDLSADGLTTFSDYVRDEPWESAKAAAGAVGNTFWDWSKRMSAAVIGGVLGP